MIDRKIRDRESLEHRISVGSTSYTCKMSTMSAGGDLIYKRMDEVVCLRQSARIGFGYGLHTTCDLQRGMCLRSARVRDLAETDPMRIKLVSKYGALYTQEQTENLTIDSLLNDEIMSYPLSYSYQDIWKAVSSYVDDVKKGASMKTLLNWDPTTETWRVTSSSQEGTELFKMYACGWFTEFLFDIHASVDDKNLALQYARNVVKSAMEFRNHCPEFFACDPTVSHLWTVFNALF